MTRCLHLGLRCLAWVSTGLAAGTAWAAENEIEPSGGPSSAMDLLLAGLGVALLVAAAALYMCLRSRRQLHLEREVLAAVPHPRQVVDARGQSLYSNPAFHTFFQGADREAGRGSDRTIPELLAARISDEAVGQSLAGLRAEAERGQAGRIEVPLMAGRLDQSQAAGTGVEWYSVSTQPLSTKPGAVLWMIDSLGLGRQMEQALRLEQESFVELLENAPIGFYSVDAEGRFLIVNSTLAEWVGLVPQQMLDGLRLHEVVADALPEGTPGFAPFANGETGRGAVQLRNGRDHHFQAYIAQDVVRDDGGRPLRTRSVVRHLSHEQAMAEALAQSEHRFERFFEEAPVGIALIDAAGRVRESNAAMRQLAGVADELPPDRSLLDLVAEADRPAVRAGLEQVAASGSAAINMPIEVRLAGSSERVCALFITRLEQGTDLGGGFIVHFIDLTEQKNLEVQFSQSQKMQAIGKLAGGIAHDFNNLLTAMMGFSELLLQRHRPGDQSFADIMQIMQSGNRAKGLVRHLLAYSRQQTLQPRVLNVTDILAELYHLLRRLISEGVELKMVHGRDLGSIKADQSQLEQVIINLVVNSTDAMPDGGLLEIRTDNFSLDRDSVNRGEVMPAADYTCIQVIDSGQGIDPQYLDRIFEPFFTTKEVGAGTGLGLSTVYGTVKQTGGFIFVESELGKGTTFSIYLPHYLPVEGELPVELVPEKEPSRDLTGIGTVLLVEDEDGVRAFSARALRNKGYEVLEARSGDAALDLLNRQNGPIDLLITDVVMPKVDGPTLVRKVREQRPDLKVIFISGYTEDAFRRKLVQDTGIHFLPKPFSLKQLAGKVKEVMRDKVA